MFEAVILGMIQGVAEWLPVSSSALVTLVSINFFGGGATEAISLALFLHIGTFFSVVVYYRSELLAICRGMFRKGVKENSKTTQLTQFLLLTSVISIMFAGGLYLLGEQFLLQLESSGRFLTGVIGVLLLVSGVLQIYFKQKGERTVAEQQTKDGLILGLVQGLAVIPGISRSGITIATLLFRQFAEREALRLSFLMSLPIVFIGNIALQFSGFVLTTELVISALTAFLFGLLTIHVLVQVARHAVFGYLALVFGVLSLVSVLL